MDTALITYRGTVYPWHCDHMGHMNVMWYTHAFDEAVWYLLASLGLTASRFRGEALAMAAVEQHVTYKRELHAGDTITVRSRVLDMQDKSIRIGHELTHDESGDIAATCVVVGVLLDATTRRARAFPADVRERTAIAMDERAVV